MTKSICCEQANEKPCFLHWRCGVAAPFHLVCEYYEHTCTNYKHTLIRAICRWSLTTFMKALHTLQYILPPTTHKFCLCFLACGEAGIVASFLCRLLHSCADVCVCIITWGFICFVWLACIFWLGLLWCSFYTVLTNKTMGVFDAMQMAWPASSAWCGIWWCYFAWVHAYRHYETLHTKAASTQH